MDVIPVQGWIWKAVMSVQSHGAFVAIRPVFSRLLVRRSGRAWLQREHRGRAWVRENKEKGDETDEI